MSQVGPVNYFKLRAYAIPWRRSGAYGLDYIFGEKWRIDCVHTDGETLWQRQLALRFILDGVPEC